MKHPIPNLILALALMFLGLSHPLQAETLVEKGSAGWSILHIVDAVDPAVADPDFNTTWLDPFGRSYNGLAFSGGQVSPFKYGTINGLSGGTVLAKPPSGSRYTSYFYKTIVCTSNYANVELSILADDGAFIYLNGALIAEDGVSGADTFTRLSDGLGDESTYDTLALTGIPTLQIGTNVLALSLHQQSTSSSDLGFDLQLDANPILVTHDSAGWAMLSPLDGSTNGFDPTLSNANFNTTWYNQSFGGYTGTAYAGPAFTTGHQAPFAYGGISSIPAPNTAIPKPNSGTRGTAYFLKEIDGGTNGVPHVGMDILADDGAYIYLNGVLVGVAGTLPTAATNDTWAQQASSFVDETELTSITWVSPPALQPGPNLLAISVHQQSTTSSDLGLSFALTQTPPPSTAINLVRGPYLQSAAPDRMTVRWRTDALGNSILRYGDATNNLTETITVPSSTTEHEITVTNLTPATRYFYEIASDNGIETMTAGGQSDYYFQTYPVPGTHTPTRVWVVGDSGTTSTAKDNVYTAYRTRTGSAHTDAWLMLGDNAYNSGTDAEFQAAVFDAYPELLRNTALWSCIGNHETYTSSGAPYINIHTFPTAGESGGIASGSERYYSFDHGNIHFICLDSQTSGNYDDVPGGGGMVDWLELDLQATDKDWIVAYFHHGPYTKGSHDSDAEIKHIVMRRYVTPLLERYGVDLVLSGHSHAYERSMLLNGHHSHMSTADSTSSTFVLATHGLDSGNGSTLGSVDASGNFQLSGADGAYEKPLATGEQGAVYVICGASGKISAWDNGSTAVVNPIPHPVFVVNLRVMGSMILEIDGNTLHAQYIDGANAIRDDFTIVKGSTYQIKATVDHFDEADGNPTATLALQRTGATTLAENVSYQIAGSTSNGIDYSPALSGVQPFLVGETNRLIQLTALADSFAEGDETVDLALLPATQAAGTNGASRARYFLGTNSQATATLHDKSSQAWWFGQLGAETLTDALWRLDSDGDGLDRLKEYAFGGTVGADDSSLLPQSNATNGNFEIHYLINHALPDLSYLVQSSTNLLSGWSTNDVSTGLADTPNPTGTELWKSSTPQDAPEKFLQLRIEHL